MAVAYEAGPTGWAIKRLLEKLGVACDVIAPSLVPVRPGDRVKADRRDAKKLVRLLRAGELTFVMRPSPGPTAAQRSGRAARIGDDARALELIETQMRTVDAQLERFAHEGPAGSRAFAC